ncbi:MAG: hypothetical protein A2Y34_11860 [Spirochaetes bacterium GWC1_27_15]|nr:MAG: hypothetical protein A2Z98_13440 [Spirochaetes bacterium GWB1_27_13]OHD20923.1 MAG: hypothetical protein A2Y34_11860 [Spirochaetes bacterium GWC1_27_15]
MEKLTFLFFLSFFIIASCTTPTSTTTTTSLPFAVDSIKGTVRNETGEWIGRIIDYVIPSQYSDIATKTITVVLPPNYSQVNQYSTIYMHDGQNAFNYDPYGHGGWQAHTTINNMVKDNSIDPIVLVCIPNAGSNRSYEYTNQSTGAPHYINYIKDRIIPVVEYNYSLVKSKDGRIICGSSYGGVISLFAGWNESDTFGKIIAMSPSIQVSWITPMVTNNTKPNIKLYIDTGSLEDPYQDTTQFKNTLVQKGFVENTNLKYVYGIGQDHNEEAWRQRLPAALYFMVGK